MHLATLVISGREWIVPAAVFAVAMLGLLLWIYGRAPASGGVRTAAFLLKLLGVLTLAACVIEPLWTSQRARPGANLFVVLADNSQGMQIKDHDSKQSRSEFLRGLLTSETQVWPGKLEQNFQVRRYFFDSRLQSTRDFAEMNFDGRSTSMGNALKNLAERYQGQPLAGVLLLTDGNATDLPDGKLDVAGLPPVYPVVIGKDDAIKDVALQKVAVSQTAFEDAPVTVQADVASGGYAGQNIVAQLLDSSGKQVEEQSLRARDGEVMPFRFQLKPEKPGLSFYRVRVSAKDELGQFDKPETSTEATLANNSRVMVVNRGKGPYRILYIAGQPKWEFKFMNRALDEDEQIRLVAMIRIARREPKFTFRGRPGESSNPLFRGFDNQPKDEVEQYDQPVFVRLLPDGSDSGELIGGFPKTAEELYAYSAVVIDDLEAEYFTRDQMSLLQKFVSERGGGLLMMGGADSFHQGKYDRTPIGDMLPVYLDHVAEGGPFKELHLTLTHEGWLQPWARLRNNETEEKRRMESMPAFQTMNQVRDLKPGASTIAEVHDEKGHRYPALTVQRFGNGRVGALMLADLWRWGFHDEAMHKDLDKAWRELYRWLVSDVPTRIDFQVESKKGDANQAMLLQVRVKDKSFQAMDNVIVAINVRTVTSAAQRTNGLAAENLVASTNSVRLVAEPSHEAGLYEATYIPRETGGYLAEAVVTDSAGAEAGRADAGWTADPAAEEYRSLKPNRALMERIAKQTGGQVVAAEKLEDFAASLPNRQAPITETWTSPIWNRPAVFLFALACFVGEWGLRRWKGLA